MMVVVDDVEMVDNGGYGGGFEDEVVGGGTGSPWCKSKKLRHKEVTMVKVQWKHHRGANVTWEAEEDMKRRYPHLFE
ncbi:hypothetical protein L6452_04292 [Arctium lappa]|uniref:Uncharacterized protein n=1 Tax=Arctium lappa TaxID=4217 RepID=A0ACB9FP01_ARCLA|nr:hypothetical protein L6452_04292 [Arctium lappa]